MVLNPFIMIGDMTQVNLVAAIYTAPGMYVQYTIAADSISTPVLCAAVVCTPAGQVAVKYAG